MLEFIKNQFWKVKHHRLKTSRRRVSALEEELSRRDHTQKTVEQYAQRLEAQLQIDQAILEAQSPKEIATVAITHLRKIAECQQASLVILNPETGNGEVFANSTDHSSVYPDETIIPRNARQTLSKLSKGEVFIVEDITALPQCSQTDSDLLAIGIHAYAVTPLSVGKDIIGFFALDRSTPGPFLSTHIEIAQEVATSLAVAIENAKLFEAEAKRRAEAEALRLALEKLTLDIDSGQILTQILISLEEVLPYDSAALFLIQGEHLHAVAARGFPDHITIVGRNYPRAGDFIIQQLEEHHKALSYNDAGSFPDFKDWGNKDQIRSWLGIPLIARGELIGSLTIASHTPDAYQTRDVELAQSFANYAAIALENARLFTDARQQAEQLSALHETTIEISGELQLPNLLDAILQRAIDLLEACGGELALFDDESQFLLTVASHKMGQDFVNTTLRLGEGVMGQVALTYEPVIIPDYNLWEGKSPQYTSSSWRSVMAAPMLAAHQLVGAIGIISTKDNVFFTESELNVLDLFAQQAAIAVKNARLFGEVQRLAITDELTGLANRRQLFSLGRHEFNRARRFERPLSAIMIDLDFFKDVNDQYGHLVGDEVLVGFVKECFILVRDIDIVGRYGGEEFTIILPETSIQQALSIADRLRNCIQITIIETAVGPLNITISLGVTTLTSNMKKFEELIHKADLALYQAKNSGRNRVVAL